MDIWDGTNTSRGGSTQKSCDRVDYISVIKQMQLTQTEVNLKQNDTSGGEGGVSGYYKLAQGTTPTANAEAGYSIIWADTDGYLYNEYADGNDYLVYDDYSIRGSGGVENNVSLGKDSLRINVNGGYNISIGMDSLYSIQYGNRNVSIGVNTLKNSTASENIAIGYNAMQATIGGATNTVIGVEALRTNTTGDNNIAIGNNSLYSNLVGNKNIAIGVNALKYNTALGNIAIGYDAMLDNLAGTGNTAVGLEALKTNTSGIDNTAFGYMALASNVTSNQNTGVGYQALSATTDEKNTALGYHTLKSNTSGSNNTGIGHNAQGSSATTDNEITLGDANVATLRCNTQSIVALSDLRDKTNISDLPLGIDFINKTRPVKFTWDRREANEQNGQEAIGFIAQDLLETQHYFAADYVNSVLESNPEKLEASYASLIPIMVQALKDLSKENQELRNLITNT